MKRKLLVIGLLLLFGAVRMQFEEQLTQEHRRAFFRNAKLDLDLRQRLGQMGFLAALSGFRSLVADVLWIQAHTAWERTEWGRMALLFDTVTSLQPRAVLFWDMAAWHMAYNASVAALQDESQPREALRLRRQREYFKLGEDFLLRGIQNNPDRPLLYDRLGMLYSDKFKDPCKAFEAYENASKFPNAPSYARRFAALQLSLCPGREREAYERIVTLFKEGERERMPTLVTRLKELQEKLSVPPEERLL